MPARAPRSPPCSGQKAGLRAGNPNRLKMISDEPRYYLFKCGTRRRRAGRGKQGNGTAEPERECRSSEDEEEEEHVAGPPRAGWRGARMRRLHPFRDTRLPPLK